jgi:ubiquinone/menaquinone biosynthesis C-methylase UbiE
MPTNYDSIAGIYDFLSRLIFGRQIVKAQVCLLKYVPPGSSILIAGGGTGWILERVAEEYPRGLTIDYVESSRRMIALSQKRNFKENAVNFIHVPIEDFTTDKQYDVIITPFLFDNFRIDKLEFIFAKSDAMLKTNGLWLYADFVYDKSPNHLWQRLLLKAMYLFFRITSTVEAQELINMDKYFAPSYQVEFEEFYYFKFIRSVVYRKITSS